jgi:crossover junction endodeoxyribonuclease RusA
MVLEWRDKFKELAEEAGIPRLAIMYIEATPNLKDRRFQDTAACNPAVKAAIDGIVDAGVVPDDRPEFLKWILFHPCKLTPGQNGLTIRVIGKEEASNQLTFL